MNSKDLMKARKALKRVGGNIAGRSVYGNGTNAYLIKSKIKEAREITGLTQKEFAKLVGVSESSINAYESGRRTPALDTACMMEDYLDLAIIEAEEREAYEWQREQDKKWMESWKN